jgi:hypothetical protein
LRKQFVNAAFCKLAEGGCFCLTAGRPVVQSRYFDSVPLDTTPSPTTLARVFTFVWLVADLCSEFCISLPAL